jgi:arylsulfate sulfotransferase
MPRLAAFALVLACAALAACSQPPAEVVGDISLEMNPSGRVPLAGLLKFSTDQPARVSLTIGDDEASTTVTPKDEFNTEHELMVLGLRAGRVNTVAVSLENESGAVTEPPPIEIETPPLPDDFPPINVTLSRPALMESGYTFIPVLKQTTNDEMTGKHVAIDAQGEVVWWQELEFADQFRLQNGNLLTFYDERFESFVEMDMLGNVVRRWHAANLGDEGPADSIPVSIDTVHHDLIELPSETFLVLSSEPRTYDDYPTSVTDAEAPLKTTTIIGDVIVEFRKDGSVVRESKLLDLIDPYRLGYESMGVGFYQNIYDDELEAPGLDHSHGNGMAYIEESDSVILSIRHQDAVVKINLAENRLEWILGDPAGWNEPWSELLLEPVGDVEWFYGQHAPAILPSGNLLLYDNGSAGRAIPPNPQAGPATFYSRAVEFEIDEENRTVRQVWAYGDREENRFWGAALGDVDRQPDTGNILVTTGAFPPAILTLPPDFEMPQMAPTAARDSEATDEAPVNPFEQFTMTVLLTEVTHSDPPEKVWEVSIEDPAQNWLVYRAERFPSLYP